VTEHLPLPTLMGGRGVKKREKGSKRKKGKKPLSPSLYVPEIEKKKIQKKKGRGRARTSVEDGPGALLSGERKKFKGKEGEHRLLLILSGKKGEEDTEKKREGGGRKNRAVVILSFSLLFFEERDGKEEKNYQKKGGKKGGRTAGLPSQLLAEYEPFFQAAKSKKK